MLLLDGTEFAIPCRNGKHTTAEELRELVARRIGLAPEFTNIFSVWVISGSLSEKPHDVSHFLSDLQLKPHHLPFKVLREWEELLLSYSLTGAYGVLNF